MGTWGLGSFDNDDAADFVADLVSQDGVQPVRDTIQHVLRASDYLEAPEAAQAIAACEMLAASAGKANPDAPVETNLSAWLSRSGLGTSPELRVEGVKAINRVLADNSELRELWVESDEFDAWEQEVVGLRQRLLG